MPNMFDSPLAGQYINTYTRLPFEEIQKMGEKLQTRTDKFDETMTASQDFMNMDVLDADRQFRDADQKQFQGELEGIAEMQKNGDLRGAQRAADRLGTKMKSWKEQGRGRAMQDSLEGYQRDVKAFDSAEAKGLISANKAAWEREQLRKKYKGVGDQTVDGYGKYDGRLPSVMSSNLTDQANKLIQGWKEDGTYQMKTNPTTGQSYWINEKKETVSEDEVRQALNAGLRTEVNTAWLERNADFLMKDLDPNANTFEHNGQTYTREELKQKLVDEELNKPLDFGAAKAGYSKKTGTPIKNYMLEQSMKAAAKARAAAKEAVDSFSAGAEYGIDVSAKNVVALRESVEDLKTSVKSQNKSIADYEASKPGVSNKKTLADGTPNPNYDETYGVLVAQKEQAMLELAEHESYLVVPKQRANKLITENTGDFQFLDKQNPKYNERDYLKADMHNPIYGLVTALDTHSTDRQTNMQFIPSQFDKLSPQMQEALTEARTKDADGNWGIPNKLNKILQDGIKKGTSLPDLLEENGLPRNFIEAGIGRGRYSGGGSEALAKNYLSAKGKYSEAINSSMDEDSARVAGYKIITGIDDGKYSSATAKLFAEQAESVASLAGAGYSSPDGRQIDQYFKDELGDGWQEEFDTYKDVKIHQTTGYTASEKPIVHMTVTDSSGELHQIPMVAKSSDLYLKTAKAMAASEMNDTRQEGQKMIMNATPVGTTTVGAVVKASRMESMWTTDEVTGKKVPRKAVESPLIGFKAGGNQLWIQPKKIAGDGTQTYQIIKKVKQDDGTMKDVIVEETVGGSNDLRNILHSKLVKNAKKDGNNYFISQYGAGKGK